MLNFVGIVGNNWHGSHNRQLLYYMKARYTDRFALNVQETGQLPLFSQDDEENPPASVQAFRAAIEPADGVIIATAEHNHSIPATLKNALDWNSRVVHPLAHKPVMIVGAALGPMGTVRAQGHLRQILDSPAIDAHVMPGDEFLLGESNTQFDAAGKLTDDDTIKFLDHCTTDFIHFVQTANASH